MNNVFSNLTAANPRRRQDFPHLQVVFPYFDGLTGKLLNEESVVAD